MVYMHSKAADGSTEESIALATIVSSLLLLAPLAVKRME